MGSFWLIASGERIIGSFFPRGQEIECRVLAVTTDIVSN